MATGNPGRRRIKSVIRKLRITAIYNNRNTVEFLGVWEQMYNPAFSIDRKSSWNNQNDIPPSCNRLKNNTVIHKHICLKCIQNAFG